MLESSTSLGMSALPSLLSAASQCDGQLLTRLHAHTADAISHASDSMSVLIGAVGQRVSPFVAEARRYATAVDKRLEMKEEGTGRHVEDI